MNAECGQKDPVRKPIAVWLVEILGWAYFVLACNPVVFAVVRTCIERSTDYIFFAIFGMSVALLPLCVVLSLRRGHRARFLWFNTTLLSLFLLTVGIVTLSYSTPPIPTPEIAIFLTSLLIFLVLVIGPFVLLNLPASKQWSEGMSGDVARRRKGDVGCLTACLLAGALIAWLVIASGRSAVLRLRTGGMSMLGRNLFVNMEQNEKSHESGETWVDPASCTNSTQFVLKLIEEDVGYANALREKSDIWCIAVNPPEDENFPVIFTDNIDPHELLSLKEGARLLPLTCPKTRGGRCFGFCEKAAIIVRGCGAANVVLSARPIPTHIFPNGVPKPGQSTYFLTPTGRVGCSVQDIAP